MENPTVFALAILSIIGCILNIVVTALVRKMYNNPLGKMVIHLSIADISLAISAMVRELTNYSEDMKFSTVFPRTLGSFGNSASMIWTCCFAHCLYSVGREGNEDFLHSLYKIYLKISYGVAFITGISHLFTNYVLYYDVHDKVNWLMAVLISSQIVVSLIVTLYYYISGLRLMHQRGNRLPWSLLIYPLILLVCNLPRNVFLQYTGYIYDNPKYQLTQATWVIQGFLNALVYGLTSGIREAVKEQCCQDDSKDSSAEQVETVYYQQDEDNH